MGIRLAIHERPSSWSDKWMEYCRAHGIEAGPVNCYRHDIIKVLQGYDGLLWHFDHWLGEDLLMARHVLMAAEHMGVAVFPDAATCWHFDDKLAQKYLLEATGAPLVPTYAFFGEQDAVQWLRGAAFPLVAKLRRGAGSYNVRLLRDYGQAVRYCKRAFGRGFSPVPGYTAFIGAKVRKVRNLGDFMAGAKRAVGFFRAILHGRRTILPERGYVLFQDFLPGNTFDTRIAIVGNRGWGFTRNVRPGDWRASGSGSIDYDLARIDLECVRIAFATAASLRTQSVCLDFVRSPSGESLIVEISYAYSSLAVYDCPGHWDRDLKWHEGHVWPQDAVLEDFLACISQRNEGGSLRAEV